MPYPGRTRPVGRNKKPLWDTASWDEYIPLATVRSDLPPSFDDVVAKLLAPDPAMRYQSAHEASQSAAAILLRQPRFGWYLFWKKRRQRGVCIA